MKLPSAKAEGILYVSHCTLLYSYPYWTLQKPTRQSFFREVLLTFTHYIICPIYVCIDYSPI